MQMLLCWYYTACSNFLFLLLVMWNLRCELLLASEVGHAGKSSRTNSSMAELEHRPRSLNKKAMTFIPQGFWIITENKLCGKLKVYDIYIFLFFKWKNLHKLAPIWPPQSNCVCCDGIGIQKQLTWSYSATSSCGATLALIKRIKLKQIKK